MEAALKKYFWLIKLVGVAIAVGFAGSAVVNMLVSKFALAPAGESVTIADDDEEGEEEGDEEDNEDIRKAQSKMMGRVTGSGDTTKSRKERVASFLVGSNIFCPACKPLVEETSTASSDLSPSTPRASCPSPPPT